MGTRGRIGIVGDDGKVTSIYSHWDNYPKWTGAMLLNHYTDRAKVESLISLGAISSLHENVEPDPKGGTKTVWKGLKRVEKPAKGKHTFDEPQNGVVVAYHRDRGEDWESCKPRVDKDARTFAKGDVEEWGYLFRDGKWFVVDGHRDSRRLMPLTEKYIAAKH